MHLFSNKELTGKRPASVIPKKTRAMTSPVKLFTNPVRVITIPQADIMIENHID